MSVEQPTINKCDYYYYYYDVSPRFPLARLQVKIIFESNRQLLPKINAGGRAGDSGAM